MDTDVTNLIYATVSDITADGARAVARVIHEKYLLVERPSDFDTEGIPHVISNSCQELLGEYKAGWLRNKAAGYLMAAEWIDAADTRAESELTRRRDVESGAFYLVEYKHLKDHEKKTINKILDLQDKVAALEARDA